MIKTLFAFIFLGTFSITSFAENYYVEPLICKGTWNKTPEGYHESYEHAALEVVSFKSVKAKDCSLVDSTSTDVMFGEAAKNANIDDFDGILGSWFSGPIQKRGDTIIIPDGIWDGPVALDIETSMTVNGKQKDYLKGRSYISGGSYYELECEANVVEQPSHIENNTANCPQN